MRAAARCCEIARAAGTGGRHPRQGESDERGSVVVRAAGGNRGCVWVRQPERRGDAETQRPESQALRAASSLRRRQRWRAQNQLTPTPHSREDEQRTATMSRGDARGRGGGWRGGGCWLVWTKRAVQRNDEEAPWAESPAPVNARRVAAGGAMVGRAAVTSARHVPRARGVREARQRTQVTSCVSGRRLARGALSTTASGRRGQVPRPAKRRTHEGGAEGPRLTRQVAAGNANASAEEGGFAVQSAGG